LTPHTLFNYDVPKFSGVRETRLIRRRFTKDPSSVPSVWVLQGGDSYQVAFAEAESQKLRGTESPFERMQFRFDCTSV